ncbi:hypothetical protein N7456_000201 [Penicillium angulare]|uniref:Uncharacterized protein n=1 Tax=Penicillium angulare TaxID=116970 RepID=A0A9W9GD30_9EURO|nr:hypothetical protein N7456_000201 [Penicillium angulare]
MHESSEKRGGPCHNCKDELSFIDETPDASAGVSDRSWERIRNSSITHISENSYGSPSSQISRGHMDTSQSPHPSTLLPGCETPAHVSPMTQDNGHGHNTNLSHVHSRISDGDTGDPIPDIINSQLTPSSISLHTMRALAPTSNFARQERTLTLQETYLMRHFVENLASSFDCTDKDKHFTYVVPERAITCPVLFYAICTASAGHLVRTFSKQWPNKTPIFDEVPLVDLTEKTVVEYHNACVSLFIAMSNDPSASYDENALSAATILRFYEQLDVELTGLDSEIYIGVVRAVVLSQPDYTFGSFHDDYPPLRTADVIDSPFTSLGYSACLVALRQEIWSVLINRRPFRLFRRTGKSYNPPEPAGDFEWSNHIIFWCADVLRFCFGDEGALFLDGKFPPDRLGQWEYLNGFKQNWEKMCPPSFKPLFCKAADPSVGSYFPEIFHMNDCQVLGLQHFELACILLEVYHPQRRPLGLGATAHNIAIDTRVRQHTLNICGMALCNKKSQATLITAAVAISMCGEVFTDTPTQRALLDVLTFVKRSHAWPNESILLELQNSWAIRS